MAGTDFQRIRDDLRRAYDGAADQRDRRDKQQWKLAEREAFLRRLPTQASSTRMLEIGAGTGHDSAFFARHGLDVLATDMSPAMVARCRDKGLDARVMDFSRLDLAAEWDDHVPARFFSWRTDDQITQFASESFDIIDFHVAQAGTDYRFQSLTLLRR